MKRLFAVAALGMLVTASAFAADPAADQQAMMEKMTKAATPGAPHAMLAKMAGEWTATVKFQMDPSQPWQEATGTSVVTTLMDGRYVQESNTSVMMGMPFSGMGVTGYDNVLGKYVSTWIDNMGTGIMTSTGTADASGKVITWNGTMSDPITGKAAKARMITTVLDDNHHTFEMFNTPPGAKKEMKTMSIDYVRK
jgi:uncharacterized protein DUF1579